MFKIISHVALLAVGAGIGVWWGVHHPDEAATVSATEEAKIQQAVAAAKQEVLQQVVNEQNSGATPDGKQPTPTAAQHLNKYQQMLQNAQQEFNDAKAKIGQ
jgi:hypothetical protein